MSALNQDFLSQLEDINGSFGGKVWEEVSTLCTVTPEQYRLESRTVDHNGSTFVSNQLLITSGDKTIPVSIANGETIDENINYRLVLVEALRDLPGTKVHKGTQQYKAYAA